MNRKTLTSSQAVEVLGIKEATLYAYVSRGMIRSVESQEDADPRIRHYVAEDVYALLRKKSHRRDPAKAAEDALNWGVPVLESALTRIEGGRLFYRGHDVVALSATSSFEEVAELLWLPMRPDILPFDAPTNELPDTEGRVSESQSVAVRQRKEIPTLAELQTRVGTAAASDLRAFDTSAQGVAATGRRIIRLIADALGTRRSASSIGAMLAENYDAPARLFDAALILCADHELNASSFTARVVASTGADPYAVVSAALAALSGPKHGGAVLRVHALIEECESSDSPDATVMARARRGEVLPGFGHMLYPDGDPRYSALMSLLSGYFSDSPQFHLCQSLSDAARTVSGLSPNIDFALATLTYVVSQPANFSTAIFALGRSAGWIAHAIEQYADARLIRPRARYIGQ